MSAVPISEIEARRDAVRTICVRLGVRRLEVFGSAARGEAARDLDFLVDLGERPPADYAAAYFALREELEVLFAKPVDLVTPAGLANPYFKQGVERHKTLLYAA